MRRELYKYDNQQLWHSSDAWNMLSYVNVFVPLQCMTF